MAEVFINMDARFLQDLADGIANQEVTGFASPDAMRVRLLQIARNLQSMDDRQGSEYSKGFYDGKNSHIARSNVAKPLVPVYPDLEAALASFKGEVTKLPPETKVSMKETLTLDDLDL